MTDHLEAYRRMARISRFVSPPLARSPHLSESEAARSAEWVNSAPRILASDPIVPVISPSEHIENLVQAAVKKVTVLPSSYVIQENIGDRISRLSTRSTPPILLLPKIPQPDPNWIPPVVKVPESVQVTATSEPTQEEIAKDSDSIQEKIAKDSDSIQEKIAKDSDSIQEEVAENSESAQEDAGNSESDSIQEVAENSESAQEDAGNSESVQGDSIETKQSEETPVETTIAAAKSLIEKTIESVKTSLFPADEKAEIAPNSTQESEREEAAENSGSAQEDVTGNSESVQEETAIETKQSEETPVETTIAAAKSAIEKTIESVKTSLFPADEEAEIAPNSTQESETAIQVSCPKCSSKDLRKNGHRGDKQRYICKDCGKQFIAETAIEEPPQKVEKPAAKTDVAKAAKPSSKKGQSKGFGSRSR